MMRKMGWERPYCLSRWNGHLVTCPKRDNEGKDGELRLWLMKEEKIDERTTTYSTDKGLLTSDALKAPSAEDWHSIQQHVHDRGEGARDNFVAGGINTQHTLKRKGGMDGEQQQSSGSKEASAGATTAGEEEGEDGTSAASASEVVA